MKSQLFGYSLSALRKFTDWNKSILNLPKKIGTSLFLGFALLLSANSSAYINYCEDFETGAAGWTGTFVWTGVDMCSGSYAMMDNFSSTDVTGNLTSSLIGYNISNSRSIMLSFDYKVIDGLVGAPANFGTIEVQYATTVGGPWNTVYTINNLNHVVSNSCARVHVPLFEPGKTNLYFRFVVTWANGTFDVIIDDIMVGSACLEDDFLKACWGLMAAPYTFYYGLSQWYWIKVKVDGGVGTYMWTNTGSGSIVPTNQPYAVYLYEPTGPTVLSLNVAFSPTCYYILDLPIAWDNQYYAYNIGNAVYVKICEAGVSKDVPWSEAKTKVCGGLATLGYCVPKTDVLDAGQFAMEVFPNPAIGELMINLTNVGVNSTISIYDLNSNVVLSEDVESNKGQFTRAFDLSYLPNGLYIIQVNDGRAILTEKVVISH